MASILCFCRPGWAQDAPPLAENREPPSLEDVIVTAQKRPENLQTVPLAVTAITADSLDQAHINNATDIGRLATSLQYAENASVRGTGFQVRGVGTQTFSNGLEQSVGTVVDGVVMARNGMGVDDLFDVDHVEVLRGPQGMLFGKNASAGVVSIVTTRPTDQLSAEGHISFGTHNELRAGAIMNIPFTAQTDFRLAAFSDKRDGLVTNVFDGGKLDNHKESGVTAKLLWRSADDSLEAYVNADSSFRDEACCFWTARSVVPGSPLANTLASAGINPRPDNLKVDLDAGGYSRSTNSGASVELSWRLGGYGLTSLSAWRIWQLRENMDSDSTPLAALNLNFGRSDENQWSQELRLTSPTGGPLDYVIGLYYFDSELRGNNGQEGSLSLVNAAPIYSRYFIATNTNESEAAFGQATFHFTDALRLISGARYTQDEVAMDYVRSFYPGTVPSSPPLTLQPSTSATNISWREGLEYDLWPGAMAYATVSRGYKGPGFNALQGATIAALTPVRPEIPTSYEMGLRMSLFERRLSLNPTLFDTRFKDFQGQFFNPFVPPLGAVVVGNAGVLRTRGAELEWAMRPSAEMTFSGGVSYIDAVYQDFNGAPCWGTPATQPGCVGGVFDASGVMLQNSPKWTYRVEGRYERDLRAGLSGFVSANWYWRGPVNYSLGDPNMIGNAYGLLGGVIGISGDDGRWQLSGYVRNLLDRSYTGTILATPLSPGSYSQYPVEDTHRLVGIAAVYRMGRGSR
jgi:iron complex outermembrane recepter protein